LVLVLVFVVSLSACGQEEKNSLPAEKNITLEIVESDTVKTTKKVSTEKNTLLALLQEQNLVEGEMGEYGFFVTAVNGVIADKAQNKYWMITKDGDWTDSVDKVQLADGDTYVITLTQY
jgi:hypothetical protein